MKGLISWRSVEKLLALVLGRDRLAGLAILAVVALVAIQLAGCGKIAGTFDLEIPEVRKPSESSSTTLVLPQQSCLVSRQLQLPSGQCSEGSTVYEK